MEIDEAEGQCPDCGVIVELVDKRDGEYYQCRGCGWEGTEVPMVADEDIWVPRFKRYREARIDEDCCSNDFRGHANDGREANFACTRLVGHTGPCAWIVAVNHPDVCLGEYQEYWELEDGEEEQ